MVAAQGRETDPESMAIPSIRFGPIARALLKLPRPMMEADPDAAIKAFGAALNHGLPVKASAAA